MGINSFIIEFDNNPNKLYSPGATVYGRVIIDVNSVKKINAIRIKYKGRAKAEWTRNSGKSSTYYEGKEVYFNVNSFIRTGDNGPFDLLVGKHTYEFSFTLPPVLPSNFKTSLADVKYSVKVTLDRPWKFDQKVKNEFFVVQPIDLNQIEFVKVPAALTIEREFCSCFRAGKINIKVYVQCSGFICGQTVPLIIEINNTSNVRIDGFRVRLKQYHVFFTTNRKSHKSLSETLSSEEVPLRTTPKSTETYFHNITIPSLPLYNLLNCQVIDIDFKLKFKFFLSGFHFHVPGELPVVLGHIPLNYITPIEEITTSLSRT